MKNRHSQRGGAMLELALLTPWIFSFLWARWIAATTATR